MRVLALLALLFANWILAPAARAETQVKAEDCSAAVSGLTIGARVEIHCLSKEDIARVIDEFRHQGLLQRAEDVGIETSVIASLAARLKPAQKLDFAQAVVEVSHAVDIAIKVVTEGASGSSDQLVHEVLKRVAERTKANDAAGATREVEEGFARWEKEEAERRAKATATGVALLEAALKTDLLRFDAASAASRLEKIVSLQHESNPKLLFEALRVQQDKFYVEGKDKGINFSLEVAIAIAKREVALAGGAHQHGTALNDLGIALRALGERESGTKHLEEAVTAYRAALEESTRERIPAEWAGTHMNLGNALLTLGERESGTQKLEEAVAAYREALKERTRERVPLDWAMITGNQGVAMMLLAERKNDPAMAKAALGPIEAAYEVSRAGGHAPNAAYFEARLPEARALVDKLKKARRASQP